MVASALTDVLILLIFIFIFPCIPSNFRFFLCIIIITVGYCCRAQVAFVVIPCLTLYSLKNASYTFPLIVSFEVALLLVKARPRCILSSTLQLTSIHTRPIVIASLLTVHSSRNTGGRSHETKWK